MEQAHVSLPPISARHERGENRTQVFDCEGRPVSLANVKFSSGCLVNDTSVFLAQFEQHRMASLCAFGKPPPIDVIPSYRSGPELGATLLSFPVRTHELETDIILLVDKPSDASEQVMKKGSMPLVAGKRSAIFHKGSRS